MGTMNELALASGNRVQVEELVYRTGLKLDARDRKSVV